MALDAIDGSVMQNAEALAAAAAAATAQATAEEKRLDEASHRAWQLHLQGGPGAGMRRQHAFTRTPTDWIPSKVAPSPSHPVPPGDGLDGLSREELRRAHVAPSGIAQPLNSQERVEYEANALSAHWA